MKLKFYFCGFRHVKKIENEVSITHYDGMVRPDVESNSRKPNVKRFYKLKYQIITYQNICTIL